MSAHIRAKAVRLVQEDRVAVAYVSRHGLVVAGLVRGDSGTIYRPTVDPAGHWCDCHYGQYARGAACSHTLALLLKAAVDGMLPGVAEPAAAGSGQEGA